MWVILDCDVDVALGASVIALGLDLVVQVALRSHGLVFAEPILSGWQENVRPCATSAALSSREAIL